MFILHPDESGPTLRVFVVCDQTDTAPIWGFLIREKGLVAILETSVQRAMERSLEDIPDLVVIDVNVPHPQRMALCQRFRSLGTSPILLFLPMHNEAEILEAYRIGVDECVVKPISPAIFLAKITAWARRSWSQPLSLVRTGKLRLDPARRCAIDPNGREIRLTNLEFRLLYLLMTRPGYVFRTEEILEAVWGSGRRSDQTLLKNMIYRLRRKLEDESLDPALIQTRLGGYCFQES